MKHKITLKRAKKNNPQSFKIGVQQILTTDIFKFF